MTVTEKAQAKRIKELEGVLDHLYTDAEMAMNGEWDASYDGFDDQQTLISSVYTDVKLLNR